MSMVSIRRELERLIKEVENDERFNYPPANVFSNAPLALIQVELKSKHAVCKHLLKMTL